MHAKERCNEAQLLEGCTEELCETKNAGVWPIAWLQGEHSLKNKAKSTWSLVELDSLMHTVPHEYHQLSCHATRGKAVLSASHDDHKALPILLDEGQ